MPTQGNFPMTLQEKKRCPFPRMKLWIFFIIPCLSRAKSRLQRIKSLRKRDKNFSTRYKDKTKKKISKKRKYENSCSSVEESRKDSLADYKPTALKSCKLYRDDNFNDLKAMISKYTMHLRSFKHTLRAIKNTMLQYKENLKTLSRTKKEGNGKGTTSFPATI